MLFVFLFPPLAWAQNIGSFQTNTLLIDIHRPAAADSIQIGTLQDSITALQNLGALYRNNYVKALSYYQQALKIAKQIKRPEKQVKLYLEMAKLSQDFANYPQALGELHEALEVSQKSGYREGQASSLFEIGWFYNNIGDSGKAIRFIKESLSLNQELGDRREAAKSLGMLGNIYMNQGEYTTSLKYYNSCIKILKEINEKLGLASAYANIAVLYQLQSDYSMALKYHDKSFAISSKQGFKGPMLLYYKDMGHFIQVAPDSLLFRIGIKPSLRYQTAINYGTRALEMAREENNIIQRAYILQFLISAYEQLGDYKTAYFNLKTLTAIKDSISGEEKQKEVIRKEVEFNFKQRAAANQAVLEKEALKQRIIRSSLIAGLILLLVFSIIVLRQRNKTRKARETAEQSERQKQRFFTNISHEFRTPLTLLIGPLEDLMAGGDERAFKAIIPEMYRNSKRLLRLINQLLDLSRLDAERFKINTQREDIIPFTKQIVHAFSSLAEAGEIELEMIVDPKLNSSPARSKLTFYFDEDIVEKILSNLLSNAFKYTPKGGHIAVMISLPESNPGYLLLKVKDSGTGIPEDVLPYIFGRFYQVENQNTQEMGSGIGLALVKELVELHGGKISVQSKEKEGTTFNCFLPVNKKISTFSKPPLIREKENFVPVLEEDMEQGKEGLTIKEPDEEGKPVVLVVEDHQDIRKYIGSKLKDQYELLEAQNGEQGLQIAREHIPGLVISDVVMPLMDGIAFCRTLKTDNRTSHIPIILLTARAEDSDKMTGLETGADAYLIKPFNSRELLIRVKNLIESRNKMRAKFSERLVVKPSEIAVTSHDREFIQKLLKTVEAHIDDRKFSVDTLSRAVNMSTSQLNRKLNAIINQPASKFIRSVRLQRAMDLLKNTSDSISEVAFKTGFEDPSYFSRVFKARFGCLPSEQDKFPG